MSEMREVLNHISEDFFKGPDPKDVDVKRATKQAEIDKKSAELRKLGSKKLYDVVYRDGDGICPVCKGDNVELDSDYDGGIGYNCWDWSHLAKFDCQNCGTSFEETYLRRYDHSRILTLPSKKRNSRTRRQQ